MSTRKKSSVQHRKTKSLFSGDKEGCISGTNFAEFFATADRHSETAFRCSLGKDGMVLLGCGLVDMIRRGLGNGVEMPFTLQIQEGLSLHVLAISSILLHQAVRERGTVRDTMIGKSVAINFDDLKLNADWLLSLSGEETRTFKAVSARYRQ